jgi:isopentenyldiphosphate isomerase
MELIDILDEQGNKTGAVETKPEVHRQGLWHRTAHIWCVNSKGEILLQHRSEQMENHPNMWDISAAGHISSGEDSRSASLREMKEEIGVEIEASDLEPIGVIKKQTILNNNTYFDNEFSDVYLVKLDLDIKQLRKQEEEVRALQWLPLADFKKWVEEKKADLVPHPEEYQVLFRRIPDQLGDYLSDKNPSRLINEDNFIVNGNLFGVFDGAGALDKYKSPEGKTGGYLASEITKKTFLELGGKNSLRECALEANNRISAAMKLAGVDITKKEALWSTTAAVIKLQVDSLEWIGICDSPIVIIYKDGSFKVLYYRDHDLPTILLAKKLAENHAPAALTSDSLRAELMPQLISVRRGANIDYGVINGEPEMEKFLEGGVESLENVKHILIFSDGLLIPKKDPRSDEEFGQIVALFLKGGLKEVLSYVRNLEKADQDCLEYPRLKPYDDATGIAVSL